MSSTGPGDLEADELDIEQWIFGGQGAERSARRSRRPSRSDLARFDQKYAAHSAQKKKLELAGRHDVKRFFDRVEEAKAEYRRVKGDWNQIGNRIFELQRTQNQPHASSSARASMLAKTLKKTLTARADRPAREERLSDRGWSGWPGSSTSGSI